MFQCSNIGDSDAQPAGQFLVGLDTRLLDRAQCPRRLAVPPTRVTAGVGRLASGSLHLIAHGAILLT